MGSNGTFREAAVAAIADARVLKIDLEEDEAYFGYRIIVIFRHTDGKEYCYRSKPFCGESYQDLACEAAKRVERLGIPRKHVSSWIGNHFEKANIDFSRLFG